VFTRNPTPIRTPILSPTRTLTLTCIQNRSVLLSIVTQARSLLDKKLLDLRNLLDATNFENEKRNNEHNSNGIYRYLKRVGKGSE